MPTSEDVKAMLAKVSEPENGVDIEYVENDDEVLMGSVCFRFKW